MITLAWGWWKKIDSTQRQWCQLKNPFMLPACFTNSILVVFEVVNIKWNNCSLLGGSGGENGKTPNLLAASYNAWFWRITFQVVALSLIIKLVFGFGGGLFLASLWHSPWKLHINLLYETEALVQQYVRNSQSLYLLPRHYRKIDEDNWCSHCNTWQCTVYTLCDNQLGGCIHFHQLICCCKSCQAIVHISTFHIVRNCDRFPALLMEEIV